MLDKETRSAVLTLSRKGHSKREIAKALGISRNSVQDVLLKGISKAPVQERPSLLDGCLEEIRDLHSQCRGNLARVHEEILKFLKAQGKDTGISYPALTHFCRKHGIGVEEKVPSQVIRTGPGQEMQHDTSPYNIVIGGKSVKRQCASLVLGYSRMLFCRFYPNFERFHMKIFLTEAFEYFGGCCKVCVIDNTHIAIICGSGAMAQMAPEVEAFEQRFGFSFLAHAIGHCDRKGKIERPFSYIENNFLVGRTFKNDEDLNRQAADWLDNAATGNQRTLREFKAKPIDLFAAEKPHLAALPLFIPEVYRLWQRRVDCYGNIPLDGLKYPVPAAYIGKTIQVRETKDKVILQDGHKELAVHKKKIKGSPDPQAFHPPEHLPRRQKSAQLWEEAKLKSLGEGAQKYLEALKAHRGPRYIWATRKLYGLLCQYKDEDLMRALETALKHRLWDPGRIETIILQEAAQRDYLLPFGNENKDYEALAGYQEGAATPQPDLSRYLPKADIPNDAGNKDAGNPETS